MGDGGATRSRAAELACTKEHRPASASVVPHARRNSRNSLRSALLHQDCGGSAGQEVRRVDAASRAATLDGAKHALLSAAQHAASPQRAAMRTRNVTDLHAPRARRGRAVAPRGGGHLRLAQDASLLSAAGHWHRRARCDTSRRAARLGCGCGGQPSGCSAAGPNPTATPSQRKAAPASAKSEGCSVGGDVSPSGILSSMLIALGLIAARRRTSRRQAAR
jgi:hypothetical protein